MQNLSISFHKDKNSWQIWDSWSQFQIINNFTVSFTDDSDILACDMEQVYVCDYNYIEEYFSNFKTVILFDLLDVPDNYAIGENLKPRFPGLLETLSHKNIVVVTQDYFFAEQCTKNVTVLFHDFLLNRTKFYLMYGLDNCKNQQPGYNIWYHDNDNNYYKPDVPDEITFLPVHSNHRPTERKYAYFFAANRITDARTAIYKQLKQMQKFPGITLYKKERMEEEKDKTIPYYKPLPTNMYLECYINIYVETNEKQNQLFNTAHLTEKTIEPILKFQLILPFSTTNFYRHLDEMNIKISDDLILQDWRKIKDDQERLNVYLSNLQAIEKSYTLADIRDIYYNNLDLVRNNSLVLYNTPFCQTIRNLSDYIN